MDNFYWVPQTYDSHITGLTGQGPCKSAPSYKDSARYAVDFHYSLNQKNSDCLENSEKGRDENVRAAHSGIFRIKYDRKNNANFVDVEALNSFRTRYVHLKLNPNLKDNQFVCAGEVIGKFSDIAVNSVHLHFEVWRRSPIDNNVFPSDWKRAELDNKEDVLIDGELALLGDNPANMCSGWPKCNIKKNPCPPPQFECLYRYPSIPRKSFTTQNTPTAQELLAVGE